MISIIVPVYNVQQYIDRCISSLAGQTYTDIEIILVDDGSTDQSGRICDDYAAKDDRIKVFHVDNGGQSRARNIGISNAHGDYIAFVDSDDYVDPSMYEKLLNTAVESGAGIVESNFEGRHSAAPNDSCLDESIQNGEKYIQMSGRDALARQLNYRVDSRFPGTALWPKMFKSDIIKDIRLPEGRIHEEYAFLAEAFLNCTDYVYQNEVLYHRTIRDDSTTAMKFSSRSLDKLYVFDQRTDYLNNFGDDELVDYSGEQEYILMLNLYGQACACNSKEDAQSLIQMIKAKKTDIFHSSIDVKRKMKFALFFLSPKLYGKMFEIKNSK